MDCEGIDYIGMNYVVHFKITGPEGSPYEGLTYIVSIKLPSEYPFRPPVVKFINDIFHPNVINQRLYIDDIMEGWTPIITIEKLILMIQCLLSSPQDNDLKFMNRNAWDLFHENPATLREILISQYDFGNDGKKGKEKKGREEKGKGKEEEKG